MRRYDCFYTKILGKNPISIQHCYDWILSAAINNLVTAIIRQPGISDVLENKLRQQTLLYKQSIRLLALSASFGKEIGLSTEKLRDLAKSAFLLDIGMLQYPAILSSRKSLTQSQKLQLQEHCDIGAKLIEGSKIEKSVVDNVQLHHENTDGSGYPNGVNRTHLPLNARILRILNTYESITGERNHKDQRSQVSAMETLCSLARSGKVDLLLVQKLSQFLRVYASNTYLITHKNEIHRVNEMHGRDSVSSVNMANERRDRLYVHEVKSHHIYYPNTDSFKYSRVS